MEIREINVTGAAGQDVDWGEILVMPIGDVQLGTPACDEDRLQRHVAWGLEQGAYFIGMGDYVDVASPSNRSTLRGAGLYDSVRAALEDSAGRHAERFLELVDGSTGRWLGLLEGHHYYEFGDGTTSDTRIARGLAAPFLGNCAFVRLRMQRPNSRTSLTCTIWAHHGAGSSVKVSGPLNKLENLVPHFDADVYLVAHMHKIVGAPIDQMYMTNKVPYRLAHRTKLLLGTGSFLKGYLEGSTQDGGRAGGTYVEKGMMPPVALGAPIFMVRPMRVTGSNSDYRLDLGFMA